MQEHDLMTILRMLDSIIRSRQGAGIFLDDDLTNIGILWRNALDVPAADAEVATRALAGLFSESDRVPTVQEYREFYRREAKMIKQTITSNTDACSTCGGDRMVSVGFRQAESAAVWKQRVKKNMRGPHVREQVEIQAPPVEEFAPCPACNASANEVAHAYRQRFDRQYHGGSGETPPPRETARIAPPRGNGDEEIPRWARGWMVARYKHGDMRAWPQQEGAESSPDGIMPPEDRERYEAEGDKLDSDALWKLIRSH